MLEEDDHYMISEDQQGGHQLIITAVVPADMGVYRCMAENSMGVSSTKAELRVDLTSTDYETAADATETSSYFSAQGYLSRRNLSPGALSQALAVSCQQAGVCRSHPGLTPCWSTSCPFSKPPALLSVFLLGPTPPWGSQGPGSRSLLGGRHPGSGPHQNCLRAVGRHPETHPVLLTVPKEAGAVEEHAGVKEALISTFLQGTQAVSTQMSEPAGFTDLAGQRKGDPMAVEARSHLSLAEVGTEEFLQKLTSQITEIVSAKITQ
ncbi:low quality protein: obscurin, partial [Lynx pardinus]